VIEPQAFKDTLSHWASGVTVVTAQHGDTRVGITASSFSSVSLTPPQILVCVVKKLYTHQIIEQSGCFAVHILQKEQLDWGKRFAWLDCKVSAAYDGSDHTIFVGEVMATASGDLGEPLLYYHRNWRVLDPEPVK
jgi:flavin reductase (DIM6/NTAB) family NADH-FMN oxidoreductase RutF